MSELLPTLKRGGYTARLGFFDEGRGERYFDTEWAVGRRDKESFFITATVNYQSEINHKSRERDVRELFNCLRKGEQLQITPKRWNRRGATQLSGKMIVISDFELRDRGLLIWFKEADNARV